MPRLPFTGRPYITQSQLVDANLYLDIDVQTKEEALYSRPGLTPWLNSGIQAPVRNIFAFGNTLIAVVGYNVYQIDQNANSTLLGQLLTGTGYVWITSNGTEFMIVDGEFGYLINVLATTIPASSFSLYSNAGITTKQVSTSVGSGASGYITTSSSGGFLYPMQDVQAVITKKGSGYTNSVQIAPAGGGTGVTFKATVNAKGEITGISGGVGQGYNNNAVLNFTGSTTTESVLAPSANTNTTIFQTTLANKQLPTLVYDIANQQVLPANDSVALLQPGQYYYDGVSTLYVYLSTGLAPGDIVINQISPEAFTQISSPGLIGAGSLTELDLYFIVHNGNQFQPSAAGDGTNWDAANFATKEANPDDIVCVFSDHRQLWLFGVKDTEVWYDAGNAPFPFAYIPSGYLEVGCSAAASPAKVDEGIFWLTDKGQVVRALGYGPQVVSTRRMEWIIAQYERTDDAIGWHCAYLGREQYHLCFPTAGVTWVYETLTQQWHRRTSRGTTGNCRANCCTSFAGLWLVGDYENGVIYQLDANNYQDNGQPIERIWTFPSIENKGQRVFHNRLEFIVEAGLGDSQGNIPQMALSWSNDGEKTFGNEVWRSPGVIGKYKERVLYDRMGNSRKRTYRIKQTDNCPTVIRDVQLNEGL